MSARQVIIVHPDRRFTKQIAAALEPLESTVIGFTDGNRALDLILEKVKLHKPKDDPKAKPREPKAILLDMDVLQTTGIEIVHVLKSRPDTSGIPVILISEDESRLPANLRSVISAVIPRPISEEAVRRSVYMTGFQLMGGLQGFRFPNLGHSIQHEVEGLLNTVLGMGGVHRRMMAQIANAEQRPTIAFEFKLVPSDPYDFFFLDYEWSGLKSSLHRFDWLYSFGDGG